MKRILTDLYFEGVAKIRRALLGTETPLVNSEIGYDNVNKRVLVHDGTSPKKLLQENDISTDVALGTSDTLLPSQNAVKTYVDAFASVNGVDGQDGINGTNGLDGRSAYQIWLDSGNVGSESVFLDSLVGANGLDGIDGTNGSNGLDGKSAYQVWIDNGNVGTEQVFLDSLIGADGVNGTNGTNGVDGQDGSNGLGVPIGGTAGQILSKIDGTDYNTQWKNDITETALATIQTPATEESAAYVSARMFWGGVATLKTTSNNWTALQTFNIVNTKQIHTTKQVFTPIGVNPAQVINLDNGSYISLDLTGASGTLTLSLSNGKVGGSYFIQVIQAPIAVDINLANEGRFDGETGGTIEGIDNVDYCIFPLYTGTGFLLNVAPLT